jgi:hypothetical protein
MTLTRIAIVLAYSVSAFPQSGAVMGGVGVGNQFGSLSIETRIEPSSPPGTADHIAHGVFANKDWFYRYFADNRQKKYFGYDVLFEPADQPRSFRLTFRPLTRDAREIGLSSPESWTPLPLPRYPPPQIVNAGDTIALDMMVNPATGQKLVDYIVVSSDKLSSSSAVGPARDFKAEDAEIRVMGARLAVNGKTVEAVSGPGGISSSTYLFYLAGHGRFFTSLVPKPGYERAGEVRGNKLSLTVASNTYVFTCSERVAPGPEAYNLYVRHEPNYRPKDANLTFFQGGQR